MNNPSKNFHVALTADFYQEDGNPKFRKFGLSVLDEASGLTYARFDDHQPELSPDQLRGFQGAVVLTPSVTAESLSASEDFLAIGRFGVGYETVDVPACTEADVVLCITSGVNRPMAEAVVGWMIGIAHHVRAKDILVREGRWNDRTQYMGSELRDRTLGVIGLGGIGGELVRLLSGFGMNRTLVFDPYLSDEAAASLGVSKVDLDRLMAESDFISIHCPLNDQTRGLVGQHQLGLMKPTAYLVNAARGGIVNEDALFEMLSERRIAGAAIDCFEIEPVTEPHRFGRLDNVLLAPHSIGWTHEMFRDVGCTACRGMVDLAYGRRPHGVVNPEVLDRPSFQEKWRRLQIG